MIELKSARDIERIAEAGAILDALYERLRERAQPGCTTRELDQFAESFITDHSGATPAFKGLYGFPATLQTSINEEVVHGIPSPRRLRAGDVLSVDSGVKLNGFYADAAVTIPVGTITPEVARLLDVTELALRHGIAEARVGNRIGDIGAAIQAVAKPYGYGVVRDLVGHGVGRELHEEPQVPNRGRRGRGAKIAEGLVIAIEPMFNAGTAAVRTLRDRWTVVTGDRAVSAHFEHTVAVTAEGPRILTKRSAVHAS